MSIYTISSPAVDINQFVFDKTYNTFDSFEDGNTLIADDKGFAKIKLAEPDSIFPGRYINIAHYKGIYSGTVWQKIVEPDGEAYILIAELESTTQTADWLDANGEQIVANAAKNQIEDWIDSNDGAKQSLKEATDKAAEAATKANNAATSATNATTNANKAATSATSAANAANVAADRVNTALQDGKINITFTDSNDAEITNTKFNLRETDHIRPEIYADDASIYFEHKTTDIVGLTENNFLTIGGYSNKEIILPQLTIDLCGHIQRAYPFSIDCSNVSLLNIKPVYNEDGVLTNITFTTPTEIILQCV